MLWNNTESDMKSMEGIEVHGYNCDGWHVDCRAKDNIIRKFRTPSANGVSREIGSTCFSQMGARRHRGHSLPA